MKIKNGRKNEVSESTSEWIGNERIITLSEWIKNESEIKQLLKKKKNEKELGQNRKEEGNGIRSWAEAFSQPTCPPCWEVGWRRVEAETAKRPKMQSVDR